MGFLNINFVPLSGLNGNIIDGWLAPAPCPMPHSPTPNNFVPLSGLNGNEIYGWLACLFSDCVKESPAGNSTPLAECSPQPAPRFTRASASASKPVNRNYVDASGAPDCLTELCQRWSKILLAEPFLEETKAEESGDEWFSNTLALLKKVSPISLKVTLRSIREGRKQSLFQCLEREYRLSVHAVNGTHSTDFYEGCRALLVDKDNKPQWNPPTLAEVTTEMVDDIFAPFHRGEKELELPVQQRESRSRPRSRL